MHDEAPDKSGIFGVPIRLGLFAGWHATGDLDVVGERIVGNEPDPGPVFGLRLGIRATSTFGFDLTVGAVPAGPEWLVPFLAEVRWRPLEGDWTPTLGGGVGAYLGVGGGGDVDLLFDGALGVEMKVSSGVALRLEGALWMSDGITSAVAFSPVVTLGVDFLAYRERRGPTIDPVPEPARPAVVLKGCPAGVPRERCGNTDDDAFIDAFDRCPLVAGTIGGCPDDDGDGVPIPRDACPTKKGAAVDWGCPR